MSWRPLTSDEVMALAVADFKALGLHEMDFTAPRGGIEFEPPAVPEEPSE